MRFVSVRLLAGKGDVVTLEMPAVTTVRHAAKRVAAELLGEDPHRVEWRLVDSLERELVDLERAYVVGHE